MCEKGVNLEFYRYNKIKLKIILLKCLIVHSHPLMFSCSSKALQTLQVVKFGLMGHLLAILLALTKI